MPVSGNLERQEGAIPMPLDMTEGLIKSRKKVEKNLDSLVSSFGAQLQNVFFLERNIKELSGIILDVTDNLPAQTIAPFLKTENSILSQISHLINGSDQINTVIEALRNSLAQNDEAQTKLLVEVERIMQALLDKAQKNHEENRLISMPGVETKEQFDMKMLGALDAFLRYNKPKAFVFLSWLNLPEINARKNKASMDQIYKKLGTILTNQIRKKEDYVADLGEGTFGLILEGKQEANNIDKKLHDIMQRISEDNQDKLQMGASATLLSDNGFKKSDSWKNVSLTQLAQGIMSDMQQEKFFLATKTPEELPEQYQPKETIYGRTIVRIFPTDYKK